MTLFEVDLRHSRVIRNHFKAWKWLNKIRPASQRMEKKRFEIPGCRQKGRDRQVSIVVNLYYTGKNGAAREFVREMTESGLVEFIRNEPGNERYEYFFSADDPETVLLIDRWENQEAIDRHHALPVMAEIARLRDKYDLSMKVERFTPDELPEHDQKFIRK